MNWLTEYWRPKIKDDTTAANIGENLWETCEQCAKMDYHKHWEQNLYICAHCQYHKKINSLTRLNMILDVGYQILPVPEVQHDPIQFVDSKAYPDRIASLKKQGIDEAIVVAEGCIDGLDAIVAVMDFAFIGGSMGLYVGEAIRFAALQALHANKPFICFTASGGARMQEGIYSLMQMPRTTLAVEQLKSKGVPYIVVLTNPTMGGVLASFAMLGDITLAEPNAIIGFSGRRVVENTTGEKLPDNFQTSQFQYDCGFIDNIVNRFDLKKELHKILFVCNNHATFSKANL